MTAKVLIVEDEILTAMELEHLLLERGYEVVGIAADAASLMSFKCAGCGAEVTVNTENAMTARCHWCRHVFGVNEQVANGAVPDAVLPFHIKKADAVARMGRVMTVGFEKIFLLQNPLNLSESEVFATYVYKVGILGAQYSFATAVGLFNSIVNLALIVSVNQIARRVGETSLW